MKDKLDNFGDTLTSVSKVRSALKQGWVCYLDQVPKDIIVTHLEAFTDICETNYPKEFVSINEDEQLNSYSAYEIIRCVTNKFGVSFLVASAHFIVDIYNVWIYSSVNPHISHSKHIELGALLDYQPMRALIGLKDRDSLTVFIHSAIDRKDIWYRLFSSEEGQRECVTQGAAYKYITDNIDKEFEVENSNKLTKSVNIDKLAELYKTVLNDCLEHHLLSQLEVDNILNKRFGKTASADKTTIF